MIETKFKETELGTIPENWEVYALGELGEPKMCKRIMKYQTNDFQGIPFYKIGTFGKDADAYISPDLWRKLSSTYNYPQKGDVLISAAGTIGRIVVFDDVPSYFQDSNIVWIDNNEKKVSNKLLAFLISTIKWSTDASTISRLYNHNLKAALIKAPIDLLEQTRIASALSDVDALIAEMGVLIEKKRAIMTATMQNLLTARRRLPGFSKPWKSITFGDKISIFRGGSPRPIEHYITNSLDGYNWIKIGDVKPGDKYIVKTEEKIIPEGLKSTRLVNTGDFILSNSMSFGRPYILKITGCIHDGWLAISDYEKTFDRDFLYYLLGSQQTYQQYKSLAAGSGVLNLNKALVSSISLYIPGSLDEQQAIATILSDMDAEIVDLEAKRDKYVAIRQGMMQQLLTGKIRLI